MIAEVVASEHFDLGSALLFGSIAVVGVAGAGLLAGLETGMYTLSHVRLSIRAARGNLAAARLAREYARPRRLLCTLLVANALSGWTASFGVSQIFHSLGFGPIEAILLDLVVLVPVVFLFGVLVYQKKLLLIKQFSIKDYTTSIFLGFLNPFLYYIIVFIA